MQVEDLLKIAAIFEKKDCECNNEKKTHHPMLGRRCLIRTYSAGVHIGDVEWINPDNSMEVKLKNA